MTADLQTAARHVVAERDRCGWSPEADAAINALRDALAVQSPAEAHGDLIAAAKRVSWKFGHDEAGTPSDWSEWADLRDAIAAAEAHPQPKGGECSECKMAGFHKMSCVKGGKSGLKFTAFGEPRAAQSPAPAPEPIGTDMPDSFFAGMDESYRREAWRIRCGIKRDLQAPAVQDGAEPVAWGVPNTRITERQPFMMLLHSPKDCQYPELLVPLYAAPQVVEPRKPLTPAQRRRLWDNSREHQPDAKSFAGFERIVTLTERAHSIGQESHVPVHHMGEQP